MTREDLKGLGIADEAQIDAILSLRGTEITNANNLAKEQENKFKQSLDSANAKIKELELKNMTAEELQAQKIKDAEAAQKKYNVMANTLVAQKVLLNAGMAAGDTLDRILAKITTDDENNTLESANLIANMFKETQAATAEKVKADFLANNPKPEPSNDPNGDGTITKEKFNSMSYEEMAKLAKEDPDTFAKM